MTHATTASVPRIYAQSTSGRKSSHLTKPPVSRSKLMHTDSLRGWRVHLIFLMYPQVVPHSSQNASLSASLSYLSFIYECSRSKTVSGLLGLGGHCFCSRSSETWLLSAFSSPPDRTSIWNCLPIGIDSGQRLTACFDTPRAKASRELLPKNFRASVLFMADSKP